MARRVGNGRPDASNRENGVGSADQVLVHQNRGINLPPTMALSGTSDLPEDQI